MTQNDSGKGAMPLTYMGSADTWRGTHVIRARAHGMGHGRKGDGVTVRVYDDAGALLLVQSQRGTL
jgi:hypothetical protein